MKKTIIIEQMQDSDRVLILHIVNSGIKGINYFQGIDSAEESITQFLTPDVELTNYVLSRWKYSNMTDEYEDLEGVFPSPDYEEIIDSIDELIWDYVSFERQICDMKAELLSLQNKAKMLKSKINDAEKTFSVYKSAIAHTK